MLANYHGGNMVCKKAAEELKDGFAKKPIGTGPFEFAEYQPQQFVKLAANKKYFRGAPELEEIIYRYIPSDATRDLAFQSGEIDISTASRTRPGSSACVNCRASSSASMEPAELSGLYLNTKVKPLDDIRVRQAIAHAIDRKGLVAFKGAARLASRRLGRALGLSRHRRDVGAANARYRQGKGAAGRSRLSQRRDRSRRSTRHCRACNRLIEAVQAQLKKAGINARHRARRACDVPRQIRKDLSPIVHYAAARFPVADVYLTQFYHSRSTVKTPTAVTNFTHCTVADKEIEAARVEPDAAKQKALWKSAQDKLIKDGLRHRRLRAAAGLGVDGHA